MSDLYSFIVSMSLSHFSLFQMDIIKNQLNCFIVTDFEVD
jgi:hypothetical protein